MSAIGTSADASISPTTANFDKSSQVDIVFDFSNGNDPQLTITIVQSGIYGDANGDNVVDAIDYALLKQFLLKILLFLKVR